MLLLTSVLALLSAFPAFAETQKIAPRYPLSCVLKVIAENQNVKLDPQKALPRVILESNSSLEQFQNAVEMQMEGARPTAFFNMYSIEKNEIYLVDEPAIYQRLNASIEDSLALLAAFYIQVKYQGIDPTNSADYEYSHDMGIVVQAWYRRTFTEQNRSPCEG